MNFRVYEVHDPMPGHIRCRCSADVYSILEPYGKSDREIFLVLLVNAKNVLLDCVPVFIGTVDSSAVYPREVIREVLRTGATSVIFAHNHPSGDTEPSLQDKEITARLIACCEVMGIKVLDHVIIGRGVFHSMADHGLIETLHKRAAEVFSRFHWGA